MYITYICRYILSFYQQGAVTMIVVVVGGEATAAGTSMSGQTAREHADSAENEVSLRISFINFRTE